jgi:hypothetical protein
VRGEGQAEVDDSAHDMVMLRTTKRLFHDKMAPVKSHMCVRIGSVLVRVVRATRLVTSRQDDHSDPACSAVSTPVSSDRATHRRCDGSEFVPSAAGRGAWGVSPHFHSWCRIPDSVRLIRSFCGLVISFTATSHAECAAYDPATCHDFHQKFSLAHRNVKLTHAIPPILPKL